jgi:hypothetical protein
MVRRFLGIGCFFLIAGAFLLSGSAPAEQQITAAEVVDRTDKAKYTSAEIKKYVNSLKGRQFSVSGKVHDVQDGRSGYKVVVTAGVPGRAKPFVVDVHTRNGDKFRKGSQVSCNGTIVKFNRFTYSGIGIDGSCS